MITELMKEITRMANEMVLQTKQDAMIEKERFNKARFIEFANDLKILERVIKIATFVESDVNYKKVSKATALLLEMSAATIEEMLKPVVAKRPYHEKIATSFKEASTLMNSPF